MRAIALVVAFLATPASAYHCPQGQLYRVRMAKCVSLASPLAFAYEGHRVVADNKVWYVEVTKIPPAADRRSEQDIRDQAEHDAAVAAYRDQLNAQLSAIKAKEEGSRILNDLLRRGQ